MSEQIWDWTGWTCWQRFEAALASRQLTTGPGVYVISAGGPLNRAVGTDPEGHLEIGESKNLKSRLKKFWKCAGSRGSTGHSAGWGYSFFKLSAHFPLQDLRVRWTSVLSKAAAVELESRRMRSYIARHYELPPLNLKFNWARCEEEESQPRTERSS